MSSLTEFDPFAPELRANPYPYYDQMREADPVHWSEAQDAFLCTRYADCVEVLRDHRSSSDATTQEHFDERRAEMAAASNLPGPLAVIGGGDDLDVRPMLFADPPDHTRLRGLVSEAFTPRRVEALRPHIQDLVDGLLDAAADRGTLDVITDLGFPLPVVVIAELLGVPLEEREQLNGWSRALARSTDPVFSVEVAQDAAMAGLQFINFLNVLIDERRKAPRDDLLSALIAVEEGGEHLTHEELLINCILLFIAGHETTQNLIGNAVLALLRNPTELARLRDDPASVKNAIEEVLRYDGPVQLTARHFLDDVELSGTKIRKGQTAVLLLAAGDRDPAQFADPHRFDVTRPDANRHIAFGSGIHFCLGAPLARVEAQVAVGTLARRFPELSLLDDDPPYSEMFTLRGVASLPVGL